MMEVMLTKDALRDLAVLYRIYKDRRKKGIRKADAVEFTDEEFRNQLEHIPELRRAGLVRENIIGGVALTDEAIIYLENKPTDILKELLTFAAQFIP